MNLSDLVYPVYRISRLAPPIIDGPLCYFAKEAHLDDGTIETIYSVVDDKSIKQPNLARRRMHLSMQGKKLLKLRTAVFFLADLIKLATASAWFIDSSGLIFQYKKTESAPIVSKKITKIFPISVGGAILEVEGGERYKTLVSPQYGETYAYILQQSNKVKLLYGIGENPEFKSRRKT